MKNILVTGADGQLGSEIKYLVMSGGVGISKHNFIFTDAAELDIIDKNSINEFVELKNIDVIINCAAYTDVDNAESNIELANNVNHIAVKSLAEITKLKDIMLIHVSTDYVFSGENYKPYIESNITNPKNVYGKTKLDGELAMIKIAPSNSIIIRTSWIYSSYGDNFVKTMLNLGKNREELSVIFDQIGSPTYARDLARAILTILGKIKSKDVEIYHYSNEGVASWFDFAKEIMSLANLHCKLFPIETIDFPKPASRPHYSLLNKSKIKKKFNIEIPYWKDSLKECFDIMREKKK